MALLDGLRVRRAHVVGTSMGGMVALQLALDAPDRVARLVLLSTPVGPVPLPVPPPETWSDDHADWIRGLFPQLAAPGYFEAHPDDLEALATLGRPNGLTYAGLVRQLAVIGGFDARDRLGEVRAPTLLVVGDRDPLIPLAAAEATAAALPAAELSVLPGAGHLAFLERPDEVNRAILDFLTDATDASDAPAGPAPSRR